LNSETIQDCSSSKTEGWTRRNRPGVQTKVVGENMDGKEGIEVRSDDADVRNSEQTGLEDV